MSGRGSGGQRSWMRTCRICGKKYRFTNFMKRQKAIGKDGKSLNDTHEMACERNLAPSPKPHAGGET